MGPETCALQSLLSQEKVILIHHPSLKPILSVYSRYLLYEDDTIQVGSVTNLTGDTLIIDFFYSNKTKKEL